MSSKSLIPAAFHIPMLQFDSAHTWPGGGSFAAFVDAAQGTNYDIGFDITPPTDGDHDWVTFRHRDQQNKYLIEFISGVAHFQAYKASSTPTAKSGDVVLPMLAGVEQHFAVQQRGFTFTLLHEGVAVLTWTDPTSAWSDGPTIGFYTSGANSGTRWCDLSGTPLP